METHITKNYHTTMIQRISAFAFCLVLLAGCSNETPKSKPDFSHLPKSVQVPPAGVVNYISPKALLDSLNSGKRPALYFLQDLSSVDPALMVPLPGMQVVNIGEATNVILQRSRTETIYLICNYGDDSKRLAKELAKEGYNCNYVDGGTFNLLKEVKTNGWKIPTL